MRASVGEGDRVLIAIPVEEGVAVVSNPVEIQLLVAIGLGSFLLGGYMYLVIGHILKLDHWWTTNNKEERASISGISMICVPHNPLMADN